MHFVQKISYYNIHGILTIESASPLLELEYFRTMKLTETPSLIVNISEKAGEKAGLFHTHRKIIDADYATQNKISYTEHFGPLGSQFSIDFSSPVVVTVNSLIARSRHVLYVNLVEPILRFLLISKGHVLLHSACIATSDQHSVLLSAPPDTGKTTSVIKCIRRGLGFLSDDMTIITPNQEALCFPKPMTISAHTFQTAVEASQSMASQGGSTPTRDNSTNPSSTLVMRGSKGYEAPSVEGNHDASQSSGKGGLRVRSLVHSKSGRQFMRRLGNANVPIFTINTIGQSIVRPPKFKIEDIIRQDVKVVSRAAIDGLFFLERGSGEETRKISKEVALATAIENSDDAFLFPPYKDILRYLRIDGVTAVDLLLQEKNRISKLLNNIETSVIRSESRSWYKTILDRAQMEARNNCK